MSKLWEDLKQNMKDWSNAAVEKAEEVSKIAVAKTEELTKISKIKIEIHQLQRDQNKIKENLGQFAYNRAKHDNMVNFTGNSEFFSLVEKIENLQSSIDEKEAAIQAIKDEYDIKEADISSAMEEMADSPGPDSPVESDRETPSESEEPSTKN